MKKSYVWHVVLILYILFVFSNSLTPAVESSGKSQTVLLLAHRILGLANISAHWLTEHVIRKCAHFGEYTVMGILLFQSMRSLPDISAQMQRIRYPLHVASVFFIPFVDETLQLFTEGRSGQISDVWLDMSGAVFGTILSILFIRVLIKKHR